MALLSAAENNDLERVRDILNVDVNEQDEYHYNYTPLLWAYHNHNLNMIRLLLNHEKTDVNIYDREGETILMKACHDNYIVIVKLLLERKDIQLNNIGTPLHIACCYGHTEIVKLLLKRE